MPKEQVTCAISVQPHVEVGSFANAFRIVPDGSEYILDFLVYSKEAQQALVVARVRVAEVFLAAILLRLSQSLTEIAESKGNPAGLTFFAVQEGG
jgi:hypothetical protein